MTGFVPNICPAVIQVTVAGEMPGAAGRDKRAITAVSAVRPEAGMLGTDHAWMWGGVEIKAFLF